MDTSYYPPMDIDDIIKQITDAFSGVVLGSGIGLEQGQALDDYESEDVEEKYRENDEKENWKLLSSEMLQQCNTSLCYFDADGMRFHLPAYLIASLKDEIDDPLFHLVQLDDCAKSKFSTLNDVQRQAVIAYLKWFIKEDINNFETPSIKRALNEFWKK